MALVGGGGAGNVAGSNPAGVGFSLNYVGDEPGYAYAYSGAFDNSTSDVKCMDFTTGAHFIVGQFTFNGPARQPASGSPSPGSTVAFSLKLDEQNIGVYKVNTTENDQPNQNFQEILIPPFSRIRINLRSLEDGGGELSTVLFTGRVYA